MPSFDNAYPTWRSLILILLLAGLSLMTACDSSDSKDAIEVYRGDWVEFSYLSSWQLEQTSSTDGQRLLLTGPAGARLLILLQLDSEAPLLRSFVRGYASEHGELSQSRFELTVRPNHRGRLHGEKEYQQTGAKALIREYHQVERDGSHAQLVAELPDAGAAAAQAGIDRILTTFRFR